MESAYQIAMRDMGNLIGLANSTEPIINGVTNVNLNDPKYKIKGDGTDETIKIRQVFRDAMDKGKAIDLGSAKFRYTISESIVIDRPLTIIANGANSIFEQLSWGVPCLEIRTPDVKIVGVFQTEINTLRTTITVLNPKNNSMVKAELGIPREACAAIYCKGNFSRLNIDTLNAKGYVVGINIIGDLDTFPDNLNINSVIVENVDFGVLGGAFRNFKIGTIQAKNILNSQGVDEHALYFVIKPKRSEGFQCDAIFCNGIFSPAHIVSMKSVDGYSIGLIRGENVANYFNANLARGIVESIEGTSSYGDNVGYGIFVFGDDQWGYGLPTDAVINNVNITNQANFINNNNKGWGIAITGGASATINNTRIKMVASNPSNAIYTSGNGRIVINKPVIEYGSAQSQYAFLVNTTKETIINDPELIGGSLLLSKSNGMKYELTFDPNKVRSGIIDSSISTTDGIFNNIFSAFMKAPFLIAPSNNQPALRSCNVLKTNNSGVVTITTFRLGTNGQEFYLLAGDNNTTVQHNSNIVLQGGVNLAPGTWKVLKFSWWDGVAYQM